MRTEPGPVIAGRREKEEIKEDEDPRSPVGNSASRDAMITELFVFGNFGTLVLWFGGSCNAS